jgi:hypothetical protein
VLYRYVIDRWYPRLLTPPARGLLPPNAQRVQRELTQTELRKNPIKSNSLPIQIERDIRIGMVSVCELSALHPPTLKHGNVTPFTLYLLPAYAQLKK